MKQVIIIIQILKDTEEGFVINGNIEVVDQTQTSSPSSPTSLADNTQSSANTVGVLIVPHRTFSCNY